ncbi:hypothetical protein OESDEN_18563 [Oesophagostomum dentatum]|uniref:Uncharacterized protein n=1 Tax=Oesophagostomum dentatum TaxID=61180 RepID=A0A0B1S9Z3_OESDE|nr:hypothetical protein OESDEN_18563 [Oesophagostomum dentatum]
MTEEEKNLRESKTTNVNLNCSRDHTINEIHMDVTQCEASESTSTICETIQPRFSLCSSDTGDHVQEKSPASMLMCSTGLSLLETSAEFSTQDSRTARSPYSQLGKDRGDWHGVHSEVPTCTSTTEEHCQDVKPVKDITPDAGDLIVDITSKVFFFLLILKGPPILASIFRTQALSQSKQRMLRRKNIFLKIRLKKVLELKTSEESVIRLTETVMFSKVQLLFRAYLPPLRQVKGSYHNENDYVKKNCLHFD